MKSRGSGSKAKGGSFERLCCKLLSKWLTRGLRDDCFWRSAMSGGRASVVFKRGGRNQAQLGDVTAIDTQGQRLTDLFLVECKFRKQFDLHLMCMATKSANGIADWWHRATDDAVRHNRYPMLIAKENFSREVVVFDRGGIALFGLAVYVIAHFPKCRDAHLVYWDDFLKYAKRP